MSDPLALRESFNLARSSLFSIPIHFAPLVSTLGSCILIRSSPFKCLWQRHMHIEQLHSTNSKIAEIQKSIHICEAHLQHLRHLLNEVISEVNYLTETGHQHQGERLQSFSTHQHIQAKTHTASPPSVQERRQRRQLARNRAKEWYLQNGGR